MSADKNTEKEHTARKQA